VTDFLDVPVVPFELDGDFSVVRFLQKLEKISFQGRNLGVAYRIWEKMLEGETTVFLGLAGALVPAGMRRVVAYLIKNRLIDCLVSTGANLFHDVHEILGNKHYRGTEKIDDNQLRQLKIDRIYDTFGSDVEFTLSDEYIAKFADGLDYSRKYTTREFFTLMGKALLEDTGNEDGILTSAYLAGVPIYCPAFSDSSIALAISARRMERKEGREELYFDIIRDVIETAEIVKESKRTGVIYIGGGTPKNFIQQTEVTLDLLNIPIIGHDYAIQIIVDPPHWGGLSGCTFSEAQSWGKVSKEAEMVSVFSDATIALPLLVSALHQEIKEGVLNRRFRPKFSFGESVGVTYEQVG